MGSVVENVAQACEELGQVELEGIRLESADIRLLDVSQMTLDQHVAMQPSAIAYFGALLKDAQRRLGAHERVTKRRDKKRYAQAKESVMSGAAKGNKPTVADIEARAVLDNEAEIDKEEKELQQLQWEVDTLDSWYEAWKQKSFSIRENVSMTDDERWSSSSSASKPEETEEKVEKRQVSIDRVRSIIRAGREKS